MATTQASETRSFTFDSVPGAADAMPFASSGENAHSERSSTTVRAKTGPTRNGALQRTLNS